MLSDLGVDITTYVAMGDEVSHKVGHRTQVLDTMRSLRKARSVSARAKIGISESAVVRVVLYGCK